MRDLEALGNVALEQSCGNKDQRSVLTGWVLMKGAASLAASGNAAPEKGRESPRHRRTAENVGFPVAASGTVVPEKGEESRQCRPVKGAARLV